MASLRETKPAPMAQEEFRLTIHMVASLDGYIAKPDNSIGWFNAASPYEQGIEDPDPEAFLATIDAYVMGSHTYEHAEQLSRDYGWPYGEKPTMVLTSRSLPAERASVSFFSGDLQTLVQERLKPRYRRIWVVGGPTIIRDFLRQGLVDEIRINILPILLGDGLPFFDQLKRELPLHLQEVTATKNGMVELCYALANHPQE